MKLFILSLCTPACTAEQIRFNNGISSKLEDLGKSELGNAKPTIFPALSYKPNYLFESDEKCLDFANGEFMYTLCPYTTMTQESMTSLSRDQHNLGTFGGFEVENGNITHMNYVFGDATGCASHRETRIAFRCGARNRLIDVEEIEACRYVGTLEWEKACDPDRLLLYPILSSSAKKEFLKIRSAFNKDVITQEGVDFYLKKLLVSEGLQIDRQSFLNSPEYETWKSRNEAVTECESEIERLKSEIASLKSDLATCHSQAEIGDDY